MFESIISFLERHNSFILTTHDSPDADGLGAEAVLAAILKKMGKEARILNSSQIPRYLQYIKEGFEIEKWDSESHSFLLKDSAIVLLDTSEENHMGLIREAVKKAKETFFIDHHEPKSTCRLSGFIDSSAASVSELTIELACFMGFSLDPFTATAAYAGIVSDSGFFAYPKTSMRTFMAAMKTLEWGATPNLIYKQLMENSSFASVLLQKQALTSLTFHDGQKIALMVLRREDFANAGAEFEDVENIVNIPLKAKEVEASILLREKENGDVFCSLRSKGMLNVSKIAHAFDGGGHLTAAGFRSALGVDKTIKKLLSCVEQSGIS